MITREKLVIPTYEMEEADPSPVFYDVRNHQGTRGNVYPIPMRDVFRSEKRDREYDSVRLENDYIRVVVLPELGGRIYEGYDKKADYHFVYKNQVIKPALIGLAGAWGVRRHRVQLAAASPPHDVHAGGLPDRKGGGRLRNGLDGRI